MRPRSKIILTLGKIGYILSVIFPLIDAVRGIKKGLQMSKEDLFNENQYELWKKSNEIKGEK